MSAMDVAASVPCLITILKRFGWRVFILRRRLSRLKIKIRIQRAEKKNQSGTKLDVEQKEGVSVSAERNEDVLKDCDEAILVREEELSVDLERYEDQLNDCVVWIHERTGIPTSRLLEVATSTPDGDEWSYIYTELKKLEERHVNAELWKALLSRDPDALVSVGLLPSSEASPALPETENQGGKADDELGLTTLLSVGLLSSSESSPALPETENQGGKADDELGLTTMLSVALLPSSKSSPPTPETESQGGKADDESGLATMPSVGQLPSSEASPSAPETERQDSISDDKSDPTTMPDEFVESDDAEPKDNLPKVGAQHSKIVVPTNEDVARVVNLVASGMQVQTAAKEIAKKSAHSAGSLKTMYYAWRRTARKMID